MATFVVMEKAADQPGDGTEFVGDRMSVLAFVVPVIWLAWHRLWIEAFVALAAAIGLSALGTFTGFESTAPLLSLLVSVYVAIEGPQLRMAALARRGWRQAAIVEARNVAEAELRFHASGPADATKPVPAAPPRLPVSAAAKPPVAMGPALGLLEYPDGR